MEGSTLGQYTVEQELGSGGMGTVYRAVGPDGVVALKIVHPHLLETPGFFKRFLREAEIGRRVVHPNVVRTLDCDQVVVDGRTYSFLVMECVEGQTLRDLLRELERVPEELCRHICREVASGLAAIHEVGAIHRDVKPDNVLITPDHRVKLMDLGVARLADEVLRLSQTGAFVGSLQYAAPEQFRDGGRDTDARADLHALGLVLYELVTGVCAFDAVDVAQVIHRILHEDPRRVGDLNVQVSPFFEEIVHTLIAKDPAARLQSARDVVRVLDDAEGGVWWRETARALRNRSQQPLRRIRMPRETAVYGRDAELATLRAAFTDACSGGGRVVLIEGEPGIGKSRLVDEFVDSLRRDGEDLNFLFAAYPPGGAATASGAFSTAYREQIGDDGAAPYLTSTPLLIPAFDALLRGDAIPSGAEPLRKESLHACFVNVTRGLAGELPTVILIDDLHFAPAEGLALFAALAAALTSDRVVLIGTARPGLPAEWVSGLTRVEHTTHITLPRLGPKDLGGLLTESFHSQSLAERLAFEIGAKSDGNPFFVFEIVRGLREDSVIKRGDDGSWISTGRIDRIQIPSSVLDLVHGRVADLAEDDKDLLEVAACCGYEFDPALVAEAAGVPVVSALKRFGRIERTHRLVRAAGRMLVFDHHQVQESLYEGILEQLREHYHGELASALERRAGMADSDPETWDGAQCVALSEHFLHGAQPNRARPYLAPAMDHLRAGYLNAQALELAERALAVRGLLIGRERGLVLSRMTLPLDLDGRFQRELEVASECLDIWLAEGDYGAAAAMTSVIGRARVMLSQAQSAEPTLRRGIEYGERSGDTRALGVVYDTLGTVLRRVGRLQEALEATSRALELHESVGNTYDAARSHGHLSFSLGDLGRVAEARHHIEEQLRLAREVGSPVIEGNALFTLGGWYFGAGRLDEARECAEQYLEICRQTGDRLGEVHASVGFGVLAEAQGHIAESLMLAERALQLSRELTYVSGVRISLANITVAAEFLGDEDLVRDIVREAMLMARDAGDPRSVLDLQARSARVDAEKGRTREALVVLTDVVAERRALGEPQLTARALCDLADVLVLVGDDERAAAVLSEAVEISATDGFENERIRAQSLSACLPGGDAQPALATLEAHGGSLPHFIRMAARHRLWLATGDATHLAEARRLLDIAVEHAPADQRDTMCERVALHREILAASSGDDI